MEFKDNHRQNKVLQWDIVLNDVRDVAQILRIELRNKEHPNLEKCLMLSDRLFYYIDGVQMGYRIDKNPFEGMSDAEKDEMIDYLKRVRHFPIEDYDCDSNSN